ncbi:MAG: lysylphosphatidylglycerol synthase transmembrane domain-containing protein [Sulfurimonas sp.]|jgi:hypothetical protein
MKYKAYKKWLILGLKALLIVGILRYLISGIEWKSFIQALDGYSMIPLMIGILLIILNDIIQGARWRFLTRGQCSLQASFESIVVGGFLNVILPAKLGEVSRLIYLRNLYNYPINYGVSSMVIERSADLFMIACFLAAGAGIASGSVILQVSSVLFAIVMVGIIFAMKIGKGKLLRSFLQRIPIRFIRIYSQKIVRLIVRDLGIKRTLWVLGYTLFLRGIYFFTVAFFINQVASFDLSLGELFVIYLVSSIAFAIPLAPGGAGTFHAGMVMAMGWYGVMKEEALAIAIVFHLLINLVPIFLALIIIVIKKIPLSRMVRIDEKSIKILNVMENEK